MTKMSAFPLLVNIVLEILVKEIRKGEILKDIHIEKGEIKLPLFANGMILCMKN